MLGSAFSPSLSLCVCQSGSGAPSVGAISDVAMIQGRVRLALTIWHNIVSSVVSNGACGVEKKEEECPVSGQ